jgi:hypothetical protein
VCAHRPHGDGEERGGKFYGRTTNYGRDHHPPLSPGEFYEHFRFDRKDIDRLCNALQIPETFYMESRCSVNGEEALLIYLKVALMNKQ